MTDPPSASLADSDGLDVVRRDFFAAVGQVASILSVSPDYRHLRLEHLVKLVSGPLAHGQIHLMRPTSAETRAQLPNGLAGLIGLRAF